jgi:hypothetical protein
VEAALTAALAAAGMNAGPALGAVLAYRLVNFWMILLGGGIVLIFLTRKRDSKIRPYPRDGDEASPNGEARTGREAQPTVDHPG